MRRFSNKLRWLHTQALTLRHISQEASIRKAVMCQYAVSTSWKGVVVTMSITLIHANTANPVFCFMDKKRAEGRHFCVYTVADTATFLRIYYINVKE